MAKIGLKKPKQKNQKWSLKTENGQKRSQEAKIEKPKMVSKDQKSTKSVSKSQNKHQNSSNSNIIAYGG